VLRPSSGVSNSRKPRLVEVVADDLVEAMAQLQSALERRAAQVEEAILKAQVFAGNSASVNVWPS